MSERDEFEAWSAHRGYSMVKDWEGAYKSLGTYDLWQAWQAARATPQQAAVPALTDEQIFAVALAAGGSVGAHWGEWKIHGPDLIAFARALLASPQPKEPQ